MKHIPMYRTFSKEPKKPKPRFSSFASDSKKPFGLFFSRRSRLVTRNTTPVTSVLTRGVSSADVPDVCPVAESLKEADPSSDDNSDDARVDDSDDDDDDDDGSS